MGFKPRIKTTQIEAPADVAPWDEGGEPFRATIRLSITHKDVDRLAGAKKDWHDLWPRVAPFVLNWNLDTPPPAEVGPEVAHFPTGGTALLPHDSLYRVPDMTYISPHNTYDQRSGGGITVDFSGATFQNTSRAEMDAWATEDFIPALAEEMDRHRTAWGLR